MKPIKFLPIVMIAAAGLVASCSTSKLAQTKANDDVYNTVAKAREVEAYVPPQTQVQAQGQPDYDDEYYGTSNPYYDMDYSSRINRFYNGYSWRGYYDPYYENFYYGNSYGVTNYLGYGLGWNTGFGLGGWGWGGGFGYGSIWNNPFYYGNFGYGWNNWGWNAWGPYSYYDRFGWGGGWYGGGWGVGGGYYGGGIYTNSNYKPRPNRDGDNRGAYGNRGTSNIPSNGNYGRPSTVNNNAGRPERWSNGNNSTVSGRPAGTSSRPSRDDSYRPQPQPQSVQPSSRPDRGSYSPPPAQSSGGGGGGSTSGGGGGGRPTRGGN
ncbi:hypothetical protein DU508_03380 [Pedobacter chinensis]|uniref:Prolyl-tRNA synthetase n=1 Tax=Pedobacter chinensis TaxID=2282421 RepID=A0A369PZE3_9SPHI|nr:hypothetical protein [Pedobacter chinensis]RDC58003.1 hypothetical protein DU508_03380 [Pedobacter chinensis]